MTKHSPGRAQPREKPLPERRRTSPAPLPGRAARRRPHRRAEAQAPRSPVATYPVHSAVVELALAATLVFLAAAGLTFSWGREINYLLAIVAVFSIVFFGAVLLTASYAINDTRWRQREVGLARFLRGQVDLATGRLPARDALIQILLLPVTLAIGIAGIGLVWVVLH